MAAPAGRRAKMPAVFAGVLALGLGGLWILTRTETPAVIDGLAAFDPGGRPAAVRGPWKVDPQARIAALPTLSAPVRRIVRVRKGDTLMDLLLAEGVPRADAYAAITALRAVYDPRRLRPGQELTLTFGPGRAAGADTEQAPLAGLALPVSFRREATVRRDDGGSFTAGEFERPLVAVPARLEGTIESSLFVAAAKAGVPAKALVALIRAFSFDVDFQRDIRKGDRFELLLERYLDPDGRPVDGTEILYAALTLGNKTLRIYRYTTPDGETDFYDQTGASVRKALLKTPIDGARLSSGFGPRKHPILGYTKMHRGSDFAAPRGTPIMAAGNGTVVKAGRWGSFGKYVRLRHNGTYSTAYAHMNGFGPGIKRGVRVKQGQIIGYVGSTGRSTGPHLHYEVLVNGKQVNPATLELPAGRQLEGATLAAFAAARAEIDSLYARLPSATRVAGK